MFITKNWTIVGGNFIVVVGGQVHHCRVNHRISPVLTPAATRARDVHGQEVTPCRTADGYARCETIYA